MRRRRLEGRIKGKLLRMGEGGVLGLKREMRGGKGKQEFTNNEVYLYIIREED